MISIKLSGVKEAMEMFDPNVVRKAARSAISKIATQSKTEASKVIRERFNIKKSDLDSKLKITPPRRDNLTAIITATGRPISLTYFGAQQLTTQNRLISRTVGRQLKRAVKRGQGVTVKIIKAKASTRLPRAFIATMRNSHIGVFIRQGKSRLHITEKSLVTIPTLFAGRNVLPKIKKLIQDKWPDILKHELGFFIDQARR